MITQVVCVKETELQNERAAQVVDDESIRSRNEHFIVSMNDTQVRL